MMNILSFTSGSFSGFKHVTRISLIICRCRPIAEPGKQFVTPFPYSNTLLWAVNPSVTDGYLGGRHFFLSQTADNKQHHTTGFPRSTLHSMLCHNPLKIIWEHSTQ
jgi:hypothetical protein